VLFCYVPSPVGPDPPPALAVDSAAARLAYTIRASAAAGITTAVWQRWNLAHGIWLTISAVVVIQPRRGETWAKGVNRIVGTLIGAAVATVCATFLPANALTVALAVAVTILLCWGSGRLRDPMPLAALTTVLVFTFDRQEQALAAGLWRCVEIIAGVAIGVVLTAIPVPGE
jgi:uncharacterized membrane protein YccC